MQSDTQNEPHLKGTDKDIPVTPLRDLCRRLFQWDFIFGLFIACCAGIWQIVSPTPTARYVLAGGLCIVIFLAVHKGFACWTPVWRNLLAVLSSSIVIVPLLLFTREQQSEIESGPAFTAVSAGGIRTPPRLTGLLVMAHPDFRHPEQKRLLASPVRQMDYVQFTNLRQVPMMVGFYAIDVRTTNGWVEMKQLDVPGSALYAFLSGGRAAKCEIARLQSVLLDRQIQPNETVQGWVVLDFPTDEFGKEFRFRIRTTTGMEFVEGFSTEAVRDFSINVQQPGIHVTTNAITRDDLLIE